ncbi:YafY family protein [Actinoplanes sp. M2I2]|uniref:helix-turn-helix transcriptional regulator n=1 Tax=Actinoplanes sp. M2I2 TaxID=1734444 RepID=UPI002020B130|nr:YafY family protein [Actinoplanes sp. M2I2]
MTRPTARVLSLLEILQSGGTHTAGDLAARLGVDERTLRRYVEHLIDLELPVESVRGRYGGYRLAPGLRMPPLMLTGDEALAVLLGLVRASSPAAGSAAAKLRRVLPKALTVRLDALFASAEFTSPGPAEPTPEAAVLLTLAEATRHRRPVLISYTDRAGRPSERTVHPYGLVAHSGRWYVTGADSVSAERRTFRLDRIAQARPVDGAFTRPDGFPAADAVLTSLAGTPWRHRVVVAVRGPADEVRARLPRGLAVVEPSADGALVRLRAERLDWIPGLLAGLELPFEVLEPPGLRDVVRSWATRFASWAAGDRPAGDRPAEARPAGDRPAEGRPAGQGPAEKRPAEDRPAEG